MTAVATALVVYSAQILILVGVATVAAMVVPLTVPAARLLYWRAVLLLCLLLPAVPGLPGGGPAATVTFGVAAVAVLAPAREAGSWASSLAAALPWLVAAGMLARAIWLAGGALRLRQLRQRSRTAALDASLASLHESIEPRADVRRSDDVTQPVTFGWGRPVVLLPPRFDLLAAEAQRAVLCHELLHVRRHDWPGIVCEEILRAVFWFHPAIWWVLEQVHLSREQVVDRLVVAHTATRRAYMDALMQFAESPDAARPAIAFLRRRHLASRLHQLSKEPHMTRLRLVSAAAVLWLVVTGTAVAVLSALPLDLPTLALQTAGATSLELRLAESQPAAGLREVIVEGTGAHVYVQSESVVTAADVTGATVVEAGGRFSINVAFTAAGSDRMTEATRIHVGRPLAIILNGTVIAAPVVRSPIGGSAVITGAFTRGEAERIAAGLSARPAAAASPSPQQRYHGDDPGVTLPVAVAKVQPRYTQAAMDAKIQGVVELSAVVKADGSVDDVTVVQSLDTDYGLDQSAVDALGQWTFKPGTKDGAAVDVEVHITIRFTLT